jgi:signal peptidase
LSISVAPAPRAEQLLGAARPRGRVASRAASVLLALAILLALVAGMGAILGYRGEVILTGSMQPALHPGDMVIAQRVTADRLAVGDIVSFRSPSGFTITHRVRSIVRGRDGRLRIETRGDANNASEHWVVDRAAQVGRVALTLPHVGSVTHWTASPTGRFVVLGLIGGLGAALALRRIWVG